MNPMSRYLFIVVDTRCLAQGDNLSILWTGICYRCYNHFTLLFSS